MAMTTTVTLHCDYDGKPADGTLSLTLDGATWEAEVCAADRERVSAELAPFIAAARPVTRPAPGVGRSHARRRYDAACRAWAVSRGLLGEGSRGRFPAHVSDAWERFLAGDYWETTYVSRHPFGDES